MGLVYRGDTHAAATLRMSWFEHMGALVECDQPTNPTPIGRNGPALWETIVEALDEFGAVVAGGCIRDYLLGLTPKDIDVFVPVSSRQRFDELIDELNDSGAWSLTVLTYEGGEYSLHDPQGIVGVAEGEVFGLPVNIVARCSHLEGAWDLINSFDYGILQWSFTKADEGIVCTTAALTDLAQRTATLTHNATYNQSRERFDRFSTRNPGALRLVDPYGAA